MTITYHQTLPAWQAYSYAGDTAKAPEGVLLWSGQGPNATPPAIGAEVLINVNGLGRGRVVEYFTQDGYLGVTVALDAPPKWYVDNQLKNGRDPETPCHTFGAELGDLEVRKANDARLQREERITLQLVADALAAGYVISVYDSEDWAIRRSADAAAIKAAMFNTDCDTLVFRDPKDLTQKVGFVTLVYGNDCDVISDCSANDAMTTLLKGAEALAEKLQSKS